MESRSAADLARALYAALAASDREQLDALQHPEFIGRTAEGMPFGIGGDHTGPAAMRRNGWGAIARHFEARAEPERFLDLADGRLGPFRRRLTVQLVHERMLEAPAGAAPAHGGFADRRVPVSPRGQIGCAHRNRTCLNGVRVRRLTDRPARDSHWSVQHDLNARLLRPKRSALPLSYTPVIGLPDRTRTCIPSRS
jgi:hypothetical protein